MIEVSQYMNKKKIFFPWPRVSLNLILECTVTSRSSNILHFSNLFEKCSAWKFNFNKWSRRRSILAPVVRGCARYLGPTISGQGTAVKQNAFAMASSQKKSVLFICLGALYCFLSTLSTYNIRVHSLSQHC